MLKKINELKETLQEFVDQREFLVMLLPASDHELILLLKVLQGIEQNSQSDLYLLFPYEMPSLSDYIANIITALESQIDTGNKIRKEEGLPPWPQLPNRCTNATLPSIDRLRAGMDHIRTLFPLENDNLIIWGFLPLNIGDPSGYLQLVSALTPQKRFKPWMRGHRILLREDPGNALISSWYERIRPRGAVVYDLDLSPEAMTSELVTDAQDSNLPPSERMQALMQLAALDFAHRRYSQAVEKYGVLFNFYKEKQQPEMQALCLSGHGDVLRQTDQIQAAKERYQQAIALALEAKSLPSLLNLFLAAGECCMKLGQHSEAEGYFDYANQMAGKTFNIYAKCDAMEKLGIARKSQKKHKGAYDIWQKGINLSKECQYSARAKSMIEHMLRLLKENGLEAEYRKYLAWLKEL